MVHKKRDFTIYTDGGADPNPGAGGWAALIIDDSTGHQEELTGGEPGTTNNRMELTAAINALEALPPQSKAKVFTDSEYLRRGITEWLDAWRANGWKRKDGEILNLDLWKRLAVAVKAHAVSWNWIKGHSGNQYNERVDMLTRLARKPNKLSAERLRVVDAEIFIRVSCVGSKGGWAALILRDKNEETISGHAFPTTANQLDLTAAVETLKRVPKARSIRIWSASDYLRNGAQVWLAQWEAHGWKTTGGSDVKNRAEWQQLSRLMEKTQVEWPEAKGLHIIEFAELDRMAQQQTRKPNSR